MTGGGEEPPGSRLHRSWILGVGERRPGRPSSDAPMSAGPPVVERLEVVVVDEGTGTGGLVARSVGLSLEEVDRVLAVEERAGRRGEVVDPPPVTVRLRPGSDPVEPGGNPSVVVVISHRSEGCEPGGPEPDGALRGPWAIPAGAIADQVISVLTRARLDGHPGWPHLHGGAVSDEHGNGVLVLGPSGAGKSTLVANLAAAGLDLLNDEQVSLHRDHGLVGGFTRPVSVKPGGAHLLPAPVASRLREAGDTGFVTASDLASRPRIFAAPALVVLPERDDRFDRPSWEVLRPSAVVEALATNSLDLTRSPEDALSAYAWLATSVPVLSLRYRDVAQAVPVVRALLADPPTVVREEWQIRTHRDGPPPATGAPEPSDGSTAGGGAAEGRPVAPGPSGPADVTVRPTVGVVELSLGEATVLFDPVTRHLVNLNAAAGAVWATLPWAETDLGDADLGPAFDLVVDLAAKDLVRLGGPAAERFVRSPGHVDRRIRAEVLVSDREHRVARLGGAAAAVWSALDRPRSVLDLARHLDAESRIGPGDGDGGAEGDDDGDAARGRWCALVPGVVAGLAELRERGLVAAAAADPGCAG